MKNLLVAQSGGPSAAINATLVGVVEKGLEALTEDALKQADLVMVTTAHTTVDYDFVAEHAGLIFDTKNAMKNVTKRENIRVL